MRKKLRIVKKCKKLQTKNVQTYQRNVKNNKRTPKISDVSRNAKKYHMHLKNAKVAKQ